MLKGSRALGEPLLSDAPRGARKADRSGGLERLVPLKKDAPIDFRFPEIAAIADMPKLFAAVTAKLGKGEITPSEIQTLIDLAEGIRKSLEVVELEQRISALEERAKPGNS